MKILYLILLVSGCILTFFFLFDSGSRCENSCKLFGLCTYEDGACVARGDDCEESGECKTYGLCTSNQGLCRASSDQDCALSKICLEQGFCKHTQNSCTISSSGCLGTLRCKKFGLCSESRGACIALNDIDCRSSTVCSAEGKCFALSGQCIATNQ